MSNSLYAYETKWMEQQEIVKLAEQRSRLIAAGGIEPRRSWFAAFGHTFGSALAFIASLAHDSRPRLRSSEEELASHGVTWQTDTADDATLAQQIESARRRRLSALPAIEVETPAPARAAMYARAAIVATSQSVASHA